jgi:predicted metal-dependent hydrolase
MSDTPEPAEPSEPQEPVRYYNQRKPPGPELRPRARCAEPPPAELLRGIEQFNQREYFEAHETLEALWNAEPDPIRVLYKGILQVGVGCYHLLNGNYRGATLKLQTGCDYLSAFTPRCMDVEVAALIADAQRLRAAIVAAGPAGLSEIDRALLPVVRRAASNGASPPTTQAE